MYVSETASPATKAIAMHYLLRDREIQQARIARAYATLTPFILSCVLWIKERARYFAIVTIQAHARGIYVRKDLDSLVSYLLFRKTQRKLACLMIRNWVRRRAESVSNRRHRIQTDRLRRRNNPSYLASIPEEPEYTNNKSKQQQQEQQRNQQHQRRVITASTESQSSPRPESPPRSSVANNTPLVAPWQAFVDTNSGRPYYYNSLTGVTQWQHPGVTPALGPSATTNNPTQNASNNQPFDNSLHSDERHRQNINHSSHTNPSSSSHSTPVKKNIGEHLNAIFGGLLRRNASASTSPNPSNQRTSYPPSSTATAGNGVNGDPTRRSSVSMRETVSHISPESNVRNTHSAHGAITSENHPQQPNNHQNQTQLHAQGLSPAPVPSIPLTGSGLRDARGEVNYISSDDENNKSNSNSNGMMLLQQRSTATDEQGQELTSSTLSPRMVIPSLSPRKPHPGNGDEAAAATTNTRPKSADLPTSPVTPSSPHENSPHKVLSRHFSWTAHVNASKGSTADAVPIVVPRHQLKAALARTLLGGSSDCLDTVLPRPGPTSFPSHPFFLPTFLPSFLPFFLPLPRIEYLF